MTRRASKRAQLEAALEEKLAAYQASVADFDREAARLLEVNRTDLRCLAVLLAGSPGVAPSELASRLGLTSGSVTTLLDRLERRGYLSRQPHPADRRRTIVRATPRARTLAEQLMAPVLAGRQRQVFVRYSQAELELVADFLTRAAELQRHHLERLRASSTLHDRLPTGGHRPRP